MPQLWRADNDFGTAQCRCKLRASSYIGPHSNELQEATTNSSHRRTAWPQSWPAFKAASAYQLQAAHRGPGDAVAHACSHFNSPSKE